MPFHALAFGDTESSFPGYSRFNVVKPDRRRFTLNVPFFAGSGGWPVVVKVNSTAAHSPPNP